MRCSRLRLALFLLPSLSAAAQTAPPVDPRDLTAQFVVPEGLEVTLWAASPRLFNPTNIDVDARGRIWVAEAVNYRGKHLAEGRLKHPGGDRIMILEDTDGDGVCDSSKVFVQDPDLVAPLGIAVLGRRVFVSCSPSLIVYTDADGDDKPDRKEIFLTGFGGRDHDHGLHSVVGGPDGRLYFSAGNAGPHVVTDRSGRTLRSGSVYGGPANRKSDDGRVWTGGLALRVNPDGTGLAAVAHNFRNSFETAVDSFGNLWQSDNDDEVASCRTSWVMEGGSFGFFSADGTRSWRADARPGQTIQTAHWHQDDPGVIPAGDITGPGGPAGVVVYEGDLLPARFRGMILDADAGRNLVYGHIPRTDGAGYRLERTVFLSSRRESTANYVWFRVSDDRTTWFRPSDVAVGTDGAVYVADWHDAIVGGHDMRDPEGFGRILRVAPKGARPRAPRIDLATPEGRLQALRSPAVNVRYAGAEALVAQGGAARPGIEPLLTGNDPRLKARALWVAARTGHAAGGVGGSAVERAFADPDADIRAVVLRASRLDPERGRAAAARLAGDPFPAVRREAAIALRDVPFESSRDALLALAAAWDGRDRWTIEAIGIGCDRKEEDLWPPLLSRLGDPDPRKWSDAFAGLAWRLHPAAAVPALAARAGAAKLPLPARRQALDALAFIPRAEAARAVAELALRGPEDLREAALGWAVFRSSNDWRAFGIAQLVGAGTKTTADAEERARAHAGRDTLLDPRASPETREKAALALAATRDGGLILVELAAAGRIPGDLQPAITEAIYRNPDLGVRAMASRHFPRPARDGKPLPPLPDLAKIPGDARRGRELFFGQTANCSRCHTCDGKGGDIGPDLSAIRTKLGREALLDAVLNPSAAIAFGYEPWVIVTKDEAIFSGFILAEGDTVLLKEPSGERRVIPAADIAERRKQTTSVMPDNVALGLTPQELADIAEFLLGEGH